MRLKICTGVLLCLCPCLSSSTFGQLNFQSLERSVEATQRAACGAGELEDSIEFSSDAPGLFDEFAGFDFYLGLSDCGVAESLVANIQMSNISNASIDASGLLQYFLTALGDPAYASSEASLATRSVLDAQFSIASPVPYSFSGSIEGSEFYRPSLTLSQAGQPLHFVDSSPSPMDFEFTGTLQPGDYRLLYEGELEMEVRLDIAGDTTFFDFNLTVPEPSGFNALLVACGFLALIQRRHRKDS